MSFTKSEAFALVKLGAHLNNLTFTELREFVMQMVNDNPRVALKISGILPEASSNIIHNGSVITPKMQQWLKANATKYNDYKVVGMVTSQKVHAIKEFRSEFNTSLKLAKDAVESYKA